MAQLEVRARGSRRGHDLRSLDAHPEAGTGWRVADGDSGLARGRAYGRRRPLRRRRSRGQRLEEGRGECLNPHRGAGGRSRHAGLHDRRGGSPPEPETPPPSHRRWRQEPRGAQGGGSSRNSTRLSNRPGDRAAARKPKTSAAPPIARLDAGAQWGRGDRQRLGRGAASEGGRCREYGFLGVGVRGAQLGEPADARDPAPAAALDPGRGLRLGLPAPPGTRSRGGSAGLVWMRRW